MTLTEQMDAEALRDGLWLADTISRRALLRALNWDTTKTSTRRLRKIVRMQVIAGKIHAADLTYYNGERS